MNNILEHRYMDFIKDSYDVEINLLPPRMILQQKGIKIDTYYPQETIVVTEPDLISMKYLDDITSIRHIQQYNRRGKGDDKYYQITCTLNDAFKTRMTLKRIKKFKEIIEKYTKEDYDYINQNLPTGIDKSKLWMVSTTIGIDKQIENLATYEGNIYIISFCRYKNIKPYITSHEVFIRSE